MIFYAETPVPKSWYKAEYDIEKYPNFEFKFIKDCYVKKAHDIVFIKAIYGQGGKILEVNNVSNCEIDFPSYFIDIGDMEEIIKNYGLYRLH